MNVKVCKFGGTSMATAQSIRKVIRIIHKDPLRRIIVVSAPGKRFKEDIKVTDLLYTLADELIRENNASTFELVRERFLAIAKELRVLTPMKLILQETLEQMQKIKTQEFIVSRGEYLSAQLLSKVLKFEFVDAGTLIRFKVNSVNYKQTDTVARRALKFKTDVVIPGFYGTTAAGELKLLSRGGSDVTGALIASAVNAKVYENWTDVDGFLVCDPKIVTAPALIEVMTYKELRVLSFMGASILHSDTFFPVARKGIPIHIQNTFNTRSPGTIIYQTIPSSKRGMAVTGISGIKDYDLIVIEKELLSETVGIDRKILSFPEKMGVKVAHLPSGTDTFSMLIESKYLPEDKLNQLIAQIRKGIKPNLIEVSKNIALISVVGRHLMTDNLNMLRLFSALIKDNITIKTIDYGSSGVNIVIGVNGEDYNYAIQAIYTEFYLKEDDE